MADRNALRRRATILRDERYGPIYVRLSEPKRAVVDAAIEANDGRRARALLDEFRAADLRRHRERYRARLQDRVYEHVMRLYDGRASADTVRSGVEMMTYPELRETLSLSGYEYAVRASRGSVRPDLSGEPRNPWWYH